MLALRRRQRRRRRRFAIDGKLPRRPAARRLRAARSASGQLRVVGRVQPRQAHGLLHLLVEHAGVRIAHIPYDDDEQSGTLALWYADERRGPRAAAEARSGLRAGQASRRQALVVPERRAARGISLRAGQLAKRARSERASRCPSRGARGWPRAMPRPTSVLRVARRMIVDRRAATPRVDRRRRVHCADCGAQPAARARSKSWRAIDAVRTHPRRVALDALLDGGCVPVAPTPAGAGHGPQLHFVSMRQLSVARAPRGRRRRPRTAASASACRATAADREDRTSREPIGRAPMRPRPDRHLAADARGAGRTSICESRSS